MSADLKAAILAAIAKSHAQAPFRVDALPKLVGADLDACADVLECLRQARAASLATITKGGETYLVAWPTGMAPQIVGRQAFTIYGHTARDAASKAERPRAADADYGQSATASIIRTKRAQRAAQSLPTQLEPIMPRITDQAASRQIPETPAEKSIRGRHRISTKGSGLLQKALMEALLDATPEDPFDAKRLVDLCPMAGSLGSISTTLRTLERRGLVRSLSLFNGSPRGCRANHYFLATADDPVAGSEAIVSPLNDGHEKNLELVRKLTGDEAATVADAPEEIIEPDVWNAEEEPPLPPNMIQVHLHADSDCASFAYYDDGALGILKGEETVILLAPQVARLVVFLRRIAA